MIGASWVYKTGWSGILDMDKDLGLLKNDINPLFKGAVVMHCECFWLFWGYGGGLLGHRCAGGLPGHGQDGMEWQIESE